MSIENKTASESVQGEGNASDGGRDGSANGPSTSANATSSETAPASVPASTTTATATEDAPASATANGEGALEDIHTSKHARKANEITLRALLSSKEAGIVIGRGGQTIAQVRNDTGVRAGVSKAVPGIQDRVLSVGGTVDQVAKAYSAVSQAMSSSVDTTPSSPVIRLLISHLLIGSVIGKGGQKIRTIQETSGARMVASKEMLPQSTERVVEVSGQPESIRLAINEVAQCLLQDWDRSQGTVLYHPGADTIGNGFPSSFAGNAAGLGVGAGGPAGGRRVSSGNYSLRRTSGPVGGPQQQQSSFSREGSAEPSGTSSNVDPNDPNFREQKISIPSDMVGCIIGRGGSKINEIRRLSGSRISIAKTAHDETGERMFVISGLPENNEKALYLLYNQLENEKERRVQQASSSSTTTNNNAISEEKATTVSSEGPNESSPVNSPKRAPAVKVPSPKKQQQPSTEQVDQSTADNSTEA